MEAQELTEQISNHLKEGNTEGIKNALLSMHPSEIATLLQSFEPEDRPKVINSLDTEVVSQTLFELDIEQRKELLAQLDHKKLAAIIGEMDSDDAADLIAELPEEKSKAVIAAMHPEEVKEFQPLLIYPEDSAGGIMQTELASITYDSTVRDTINWIRLIADEVEDFYEIYVTDEHEKLLGFVPLSELILASPMTKVKDIMAPVDVTVTPYVDQEEVANIFKKYDIVTLPVVDEEGRLLGRITADDIIDVITEEASEDIYLFAGVQDYVHPIYTPTLTKVKLRIPWLLLTLVGELVIALIIAHFFQPTLQQFAILAAFMPAIMATGGNVGIQTTSMVVRGLGMGRISVEQLFKLVHSEMKDGLSLGIICGAVAAVAGYLISMNQPEVYKLALAIFISMLSATTATSFIGAAAPLILFRLKFDPAAASGPFLTMFNDMFGSVVYLFIAMMIF
ncbi:MAG TPA: magnesium transporter [Thermodesulfobacteriota bacterium]|nr:magnesium transporter [Thermodesulfobacteriota bacterium]